MVHFSGAAMIEAICAEGEALSRPSLNRENRRFPMTTAKTQMLSPFPYNATPSSPLDAVVVL
jgi:hypothetical protein